jgi:hypothetical protein
MEVRQVAGMHRPVEQLAVAMDVGVAGTSASPMGGRDHEVVRGDASVLWRRRLWRRSHMWAGILAFSPSFCPLASLWALCSPTSTHIDELNRDTAHGVGGSNALSPAVRPRGRHPECGWLRAMLRGRPESRRPRILQWALALVLASIAMFIAFAAVRETTASAGCTPLEVHVRV